MISRRRLPAVLAGCLLLMRTVAAAPHAGVVTFNGLPVPGASVTVTQGERQVRTVTDEEGAYRFDDLPDGTWTVDIEMFGFVPVHESIDVGPGTAPATWSLTLRPFEEVRSATTASAPSATAASPQGAANGRRQNTQRGREQAVPPPPPEADAAVPGTAAFNAADGLLINGSVNNGAASPFAQLPAFGNNRRNRRSLYNGGLGINFGTSAWDSRPYSFGGDRTPKPSYNDVQILGSFSGPLRLPGVVRNRPTLFLNYTRSVSHDATTVSALVPTAEQRAGVVSPGLVIASSDISPQAKALLDYYPLPNVEGTGFNYQAPVVSASWQDSVQSRLNGSLTTRDTLFGNIGYTHTSGETTSLFGFTDKTRQWGVDATANWSHRFSQFTYVRARYQLTMRRDETMPYFADRVNVSADAGIPGTDQARENWGPPTLSFSSGLAGLATSQYKSERPTSHDWTGEVLRTIGRHSWTFGAGWGLRHFDAFGQQDGRGSLAFTGWATGSDLGDFLLGVPGAASIALGNSDKRFRGHTATAYANDDWRVNASLTVNAGVRWEYESPLHEIGGRLANIDLANGFAAAGIVTAGSTRGAASGREYSEALIDADLRGIQPRVGIAWKPIPGSSLVVRAGYGAYRNTNVYQTIAMLLAQQPPFSYTFSVTNTPAAALTLANAFVAPQASAFNTFAVDPDLRVGVAHNWQASVQRDLPGTLTVIATYFGTAGRHLMQEFLPNTYPSGAVNPCPACPSGFVYLTSGGESLRNAGQVQLRRRLRNGFTATLQYTLAKATDNASLFVPSGEAANNSGLAGATIAQNWLDLDAEQSRSSFDQRHQLTAQVQYTSGMGVTGGSLLDGLRGRLLRGWTLTGQLTIGSGLPFTPIYLSPVGATGVTGTIRGSLTGETTDAPAGYYANPAAYARPAAGEWGNAGRNSISGPAQFGLNAGLGRTFEWTDRLTLDWRLDATNVLNHVTYAGINAIVGSPQFGLPDRANTMRKIQTTARLRF